jgi:hypothetical protein
MIDKFTIFIFMTWLFFNYTPHYYNLFCNLKFKNIFINLNKTLYPEYWNEGDSEKNDGENDLKKLELKSLPKYEDKYLNDIRRLNKEWIFTDDEQSEINKLTENYFNSSIDQANLILKEINTEIYELEKEINGDKDDCNSHENNEITTIEERNKYRLDRIASLKKEYEEINNVFNSLEDSLNNMKNDSKIKATNYIIDCRLDKIKKSYIIEKTPLGNVLMIYDKEQDSFKYYADSTMPYRYLETVGRKYVKFFNCRPIFVDMEDELRLFEEKWKKEQQLKKQKEEENKKDKNIDIKNNELKKNVFAKFKSYNKDAGGKISMAPPKNSISKQLSENKENEMILLKERSNHYKYEGKFVNFNFLQKIERKVFNKKLGLSFSEFKKLSEQI